MTPLSLTASLTSSVMSRTDRPPVVRSCRSCWKTFTVRSPSFVDGRGSAGSAYCEGSGPRRRVEPTLAQSTRIPAWGGGLFAGEVGGGAAPSRGGPGAGRGGGGAGVGGAPPRRDPPAPPPPPADVAARRFVGPRASSVYPTPIRAVLEAPTYAEARVVAVELTGKSVSAQSYALRHRILEVDEHARHDERVIEVHPEVSFSELASRPLLPKKRTDGQAERRALLEDAGIELPASVPRIAEPDLLDATVAAWSARRYAAGEALPRPKGTQDAFGSIWGAN